MFVLCCIVLFTFTANVACFPFYHAYITFTVIMVCSMYDGGNYSQ